MKSVHLCGLVVSIGLASCAAPSDVMVRPSDGSTVRCSSTGVGILGTPAALIANSGCVSDFRAMGYMTNEEYQIFKNQTNQSQNITTPPASADSGYGSGRVSGNSNAIPSQATNLKSTQDNRNFFFESKDGGYSLSLSNSWSNRPLPETLKRQPGALFAANETAGGYFIIATEDSADLTNFQLFAEGKLKELSAKLKNPEYSDIQYIKINGNDSAVFETSGLLPNGLNVHYLYTLMKSKNKIVKISAWAGASKFNNIKDELQKIPYSVKIID